jgi:hypothetical protein
MLSVLWSSSHYSHDPDRKLQGGEREKKQLLLTSTIQHFLLTSQHCSVHREEANFFSISIHTQIIFGRMRTVETISGMGGGEDKGE